MCVSLRPELEEPTLVQTNHYDENATNREAL
jgi:hypothetical protein